MNRIKPIVVFFCLLATFCLTNCKKDSEENFGTLNGIVKDAISANPLENVSVIVFNADNNSPVGVILKTNASGEYSTKLVAGNYFVKLYKQGYEAVPARSIEAVAFSIIVNEITPNSAEMFPSSTTNAGWIEGKVVEGNTGIGGALVVAYDYASKVAFSTISSQNGEFSIFNVTNGSYVVQAYLASYNSNTAPASVTANFATTGINITVEKTATATLSGNVRNLAVENKDVDIALIHPATKEAIPGLRTTTSNLSYTLTNIPNGVFLARATYNNDQRVMDPDRIAKFGEPEVTVWGGTVNPSSLTFDVTGSVSLQTPTNALTTTVPVQVTSTRPNFQWTAYPSSSDYVIEVTDASTGQVVWGGFDRVSDLPVKNIVIPSNTTSLNYNSDGNASITDLIAGKIYRWRIFASKNDVNSPTGWTLISASEDQTGLIKIAD